MGGFFSKMERSILCRLPAYFLLLGEYSQGLIHLDGRLRS